MLNTSCYHTDSVTLVASTGMSGRCAPSQSNSGSQHWRDGGVRDGTPLGDVNQTKFQDRSFLKQSHHHSPAGRECNF